MALFLLFLLRYFILKIKKVQFWWNNVKLSNLKGRYLFCLSDFVFQPTADVISIFLRQITVFERNVELGNI